jgi:hypothetical protein
MGKLREAPQNVLPHLGDLALAKPALEATYLFGFAGFCFWKAEKSSNKHPLSHLSIHVCPPKQNLSTRESCGLMR